MIPCVARIPEDACRIPFAGLRHLVIGHRDDDGGGPRGGQFVGRLAAGGYRQIRREHEIPHGPRGSVKHHVVGSSHPASLVQGADDDVHGCAGHCRQRCFHHPAGQTEGIPPSQRNKNAFHDEGNCSPGHIGELGPQQRVVRPKKELGLRKRAIGGPTCPESAIDHDIRRQLAIGQIVDHDEPRLPAHRFQVCGPQPVGIRHDDIRGEPGDFGFGPSGKILVHPICREPLGANHIKRRAVLIHHENAFRPARGKGLRQRQAAPDVPDAESRTPVGAYDHLHAIPTPMTFFTAAITRSTSASDIRGKMGRETILSYAASAWGQRPGFVPNFSR